MKIQSSRMQEQFAKVVGSQCGANVQISIFNKGIAAIVRVVLKFPFLRENATKILSINIHDGKMLLNLLYRR